MILETRRLILRHWEDFDAEDLYELASDPDVGPIAGWPPHKNLDDSKNIIKNTHSRNETYAICLKLDNKAIGSISLKRGNNTDMTDKDDECELGYWLGKKFWGQDIMSEAVKEIIRHDFEDLNIKKIWCGYYDGNLRSKRVQEKCGFKYQWTSYNVDVPLMNEKRIGYVNAITRDEWQKIK